MFNNQTNDSLDKTNYKIKHKNNNNYRKKKAKPSRPIPPIPPIMEHPIHYRPLPTWLEVSNHDYYADYTDYTGYVDIDDACQNEDELAISATLTLSASIGDSTPPNTFNTFNSFMLQQSITSPARNNDAKDKKSGFHFTTNPTKKTEITQNTKKVTKKLKPYKTKKEWKPISNSTKKGHKSTESLLRLKNMKLVNGGLDNIDIDKSNKTSCRRSKGPTESLILLQNKKLVNSYHSNNIAEDTKNRMLPKWLAGDGMEEIDDKECDDNNSNKKCKHYANQSTDILD